MNLLREIQEAATDSKTGLTDVLRKCKILAMRLHHDPFKIWVENELNGYEVDTKEGRKRVPLYRILTVQSRGQFSGPFGSGLNNGVIPESLIPEKYRDGITVQYLHQGISAYEELVKGGAKDIYQVPWPADLMGLIGNHIYEGMGCLYAHKVIPGTAIVELLDTVRNKVLDFALEIEADAPNAGEAKPGETPVPQEKVSHVFQTIIMGDHTVVAGEVSSIHQGTINVHNGDIKSLQSYLSSLGIGKTDIADLENAITTDKKPDSPKKFGPHVGAWIGKMVGKAASGAWSVTTTVAADVLAKAISHFYGLPL